MIIDIIALAMVAIIVLSGESWLTEHDYVANQVAEQAGQLLSINMIFDSIASAMVAKILLSGESWLTEHDYVAEKLYPFQPSTNYPLIPQPTQ